MKQNTHIFGKHAVLEALSSAPQTVTTVYVAQGSDEPEVTHIKSLAQQLSLAVHTFDPRTPPKGLPEDAVHQGVIADINPALLLQEYKVFMNTIEATPQTAVVVLGEVHDPHNVGAVIRSAAAFGVAGVLIPEHRQASVTGTVVKVSAGMAFRVPLVSIKNVNTTLRDLKERGFWIYGLEGESNNSLVTEQFDRASAFVLGNEARGLREKTGEECDILLSVPIDERCESLNASVSAGVVLYEWSRQRNV